MLNEFVRCSELAVLPDNFEVPHLNQGELLWDASQWLEDP